MIDTYDAVTLVKIYRKLNKRCDLIDKFIENHAYYFGPTTDEFGTVDLLNNIIDLIEKKNKLINLKVIIDSSLSKLNENDRKIIMLKMNYKISMIEICGILNIKERTAFRKIEMAYQNLASIINVTKYAKKVEEILESEDWISKIRNNVKSRRMAYKTLEEVNNL